MIMIKRTITEQIKDSIKHFPVTIISGPRQVGKSTELYHNIQPLGYEYVTLDNRIELMNARNDPEGFLRGHNTPIIIDECQRAKELFPAIEEIVNQTRLEKEIRLQMECLFCQEAVQELLWIMPGSPLREE